MYDRKSAEEFFPRILHFLHENNAKLDLRLAFRSTVKLLENLPEATMEQLAPFIKSGKVNIFPDSYSASFDGIVIKKDLERELRQATKRIKKIFPDISPIFLPRWHDYFRTEAREAYLSISKQMLLAGFQGDRFKPLYFITDDKLFVPSIDVVHTHLPHGNAGGRVMGQIRQAIRSLSKMSTTGLTSQSGNCQLLVFFPPDNGDNQLDQSLDVLAYLSSRKQSFDSGSGGINMLRYSVPAEPDHKGSKKLLELVNRGIEPVCLDPPYMAPNFIAQLIPAHKKKKPSFSSISLDFHPEQRVENPRPQREVTCSMLGRAFIKENDFELLFENGNMSRIQNQNGHIKLGKGMTSRVILANGAKAHKTGFKVESAFAIESEHSRGLRQTLHLNIPQSQISGRIVNDYLQIENLNHIYIDSYIQHPWMKEGEKVLRYIPQMINLWDDLHARDIIRLRSVNSDGTGREITVEPATISSEKNILLPGCSWIIRRNSSSIGLELMFGNKLNINLPATILIEPQKKGIFSLSFSVTGEYRNPDLEVINGLLEHYSLRLIPNVNGFEDFPGIKKQVWDQLHDPFVIYY